MVHRYFAGSLGVLIALIAIIAWRHRHALRQSPVLPGALVGVVVLQAMLGMWTVSELLKPAIVSAHLLGGMTTLALLVWMFLRQRPSTLSPAPELVFPAALALLAVIAQIALGGWVSSNYAALACSDFPTCLGAWLPEMDFTRAFQLHRDLGQNADGSLLSNAALTAIHWSHRLGALIVALIVGRLALLLSGRRHWRRWGLLLGATLGVQITIGIANILLLLPLPLAVAHNAGAAVLLCITLAINLRLQQATRETASSSPSGQQLQQRTAS
jgi:cytochrome c oxidase assembly protein subunit 15